MINERVRLELRRARRPFAVYVGALAAATVALGIMLASQTFQSPFQKTFEFRAVVDDVKGIVPGKNPVRIAGVDIGVITAVKLEHGQPVITLSIERKYAPVYRDARVRIRPLTAVQDMYATLRRGHASAGRLPAHAVIPAEQTVSAVDISRVLQTFDAPTRTRMHALIVGLGEGTADRGAALRRAFVALTPFLDAVRRLSHEVADRRVIVARMVNRLSQLGGALAARDRTLTALVRDGSATFGAFADRASALDRTLHALAPTVGGLDRALAALLDAQTELDPALVKLRPSVGHLAPAVRSLDRLSGEALPALRRLRRAAVALRPLVADLRPTAASLRGAIDQLAPQAPSLDRVTAQILPCRDAIRDYMVFGNSVGKFGTPAGGPIGRFEGSMGFDSVQDLSNVAYRRIPSCTEGGR